MAGLDGDALFHAWSPYAAIATILQQYGAATRCIMTSEERREARFQRRKSQRLLKKQQLHAAHDDFAEVFSYEHLYKAYKKCRLGVAWKSSTQKYTANAPINVYETRKKLMAGKFKTSGFYEFDVYERGKKRHIQSVTINERVVQRCLCDNALVPMVGRTFVYDNGASMMYKGYDFAIRRMECHLQRHYRKHGTDEYILLFDFSKFFNRVSHAVTKAIFRKEFTDQQIIALSDHFVDAFGDVGLGLGSQISQVMALASANRLDHMCKEILRIKGYGRYMDDGYLIHHSKEYLHHCLEKIKEICNELGITLNEKKTQIVKLTHGFTFLKARFFLLPSGRIVKKIYKRSVTKMRQKLKKFKGLVDAGKIALADVAVSVTCWIAYALKFNAWHTVQNIKQLFYRLFPNQEVLHV